MFYSDCLLFLHVVLSTYLQYSILHTLHISTRTGTYKLYTSTGYVRQTSLSLSLLLWLIINKEEEEEGPSVAKRSDDSMTLLSLLCSLFLSLSTVQYTYNMAHLSSLLPSMTLVWIERANGADSNLPPPYTVVDRSKKGVFFAFLLLLHWENKIAANVLLITWLIRK